VGDVLVDEGSRIVHDRPMARQQAARTELPDQRQRREVGPQVPALPGRNDDGAPLAGEIAAVEIAGLAIEEAEMIRRVTGRRNDLEPPVAGRDGIAGRVHDHETRPAIAQRRQPLDVIGMPVRDQHAGERRAANAAVSAARCSACPTPASTSAGSRPGSSQVLFPEGPVHSDGFPAGIRIGCIWNPSTASERR
jgi:hypothetical protein